jgi:hypothetical protein
MWKENQIKILRHLIDAVMLAIGDRTQEPRRWSEKINELCVIIGLPIPSDKELQGAIDGYKCYCTLFEPTHHVPSMHSVRNATAN